MTVVLKDVVRSRLTASPLPENLPTADQFATVPKTDIADRVPPLTQTFVDALKSASLAFHTSELGKDLAKNAPNMTPQEMMAHANAVAQLPEVKHAATLARQPDIFVGDSLGDGHILKELAEKYAPKSLLIQFCAMGDLGFGASVYAGFALDLADLNNAVIYIGGAISVGADAIVAAGQGIGVTANAYTSMTGAGAGVDIGFSYSAGLWVDGSIGVSFPYWPVVTHLAPSQWTAVFYLLGGFGLGADVYGSFTLEVFNETLPNLIQPPAAHSTTIHCIECIKAQDSGKDELYFTVVLDNETSKTYRYPLWDYFSIAEKETGATPWDVGFTVNFNSQFTLTLWDNDGLNDDKIHTFTVSAGDIPGPGGHKTLSYEVGGTFENDVAYNVDLYTPVTE